MKSIERLWLERVSQYQDATARGSVYASLPWLVRLGLSDHVSARRVVERLPALTVGLLDSGQTGEHVVAFLALLNHHHGGEYIERLRFLIKPQIQLEHRPRSQITGCQKTHTLVVQALCPHCVSLVPEQSHSRQLGRDIRHRRNTVVCRGEHDRPRFLGFTP